MADAADSKSAGLQRPCGFKSRPRHYPKIPKIFPCDIGFDLCFIPDL